MQIFFNYNSKTGTTWKELTSLHYFFELDTFLTPAGYWAKEFFSYEFKHDVAMSFRYFLIADNHVETFRMNIPEFQKK